MKVEELRIGNYYKSATSREIRVVDLDFFAEMRDYEDAGDGSYMDYVDPALIDKGWLLKFGFEEKEK